MESRAKELLSGVFCDVLEKQAFMFADPVDKEDLPSIEADCIRARIGFTGEMDGELVLLVPGEMCAEIAANILGTDADDELSIQRGQDALKELLNVTCGQFLTTFAGEKPVFDLSVPEITTLDAEGWQASLDDSDTLAFLVDESPALLRISIGEHEI